MTTRSAEPAKDAGPLAGREVVVGISGGIAVYKMCSVVSALVQRGCGVSCVMTRAARRFVTPLTFESLSGRKVPRSLWRPEHAYDPQHIRLTDDADLFLIAPATANIIAKLACGIADDLLSTLLTAANGPLLIAPAMNTRMWENRVVQRNLATIRDLGHTIIEPGEGWLACRTVGKGRLAEPEEIVSAVIEKLSQIKR